MKKIRIKLNKRGVILLVVFLFSVSAAATFIIMGAIRRNRTPEQSTVSSNITEAAQPTEIPDIEDKEPDDEEDFGIVTPSPEPGQTDIDFDFPDEGTRPIAVMIDNEGSEVLPQGGIGDAQIVYEAVTEYGATRYMALFWNNLPDYIGPVRSSRHYFIDYLMEYDAIYTHIGWSDYAYKDLQLYSIDNIDGVMEDSYGVFWDLTGDRTNYHDSYTNRERLTKYLDNSEYSTETEKSLPFTYNSQDVTPENGDPAEEMFIKYSINSTSGYYYDEGEKNYRRTRLGEFQIDRNTNNNVRAKNIIILFVDKKPIEGDKFGRQQLYTTGRGKGYYITNGVKQDITWTKNFRSSQTKYLDENKENIVLNPGQTWIQIVPLDIDIRIK